MKQRLGAQIFRLSFLLSFLMTIALTAHFALFYYPRQIKSANDFLTEKNNSLNIYLDGYFREIVNSSRILARNPDLINVPFAGETARQRSLELFRDFKDANKNIYYIYSGYADGELLINDYKAPKGYDLTNRPWYRAIMDNPAAGKIVVGLLYREAKTDELLLSTVHILENDEHGITGVLAIDSYTAAIAEQIAAQSISYATAYSFITDRSGNILVHPNPELIGKNVSTLASGIDWPTAEKRARARNPDTSPYIGYSYNGKKKLAYISHLNLADWDIVTTVNEDELIQPVLRQLRSYALVILCLVVLVSIANASIWSRKFMAPLLALHQRVRALVADTEDNPSYSFPNNELGEIASDINQLTAGALFSKTRELERANAKITEINAELQSKNEMLETLVVHDFLTTIFNRRKIEETLLEEHEKFTRYGLPFSLIILDIDHFKTVNDSYGHKEGDEVLRSLSALIRDNLRKSDMFGRWGGEEFLIILFNTPLPEAVEVAEKLRELVAGHAFSIPQQVTISLGVGEIHPEEKLDAFIRRVDGLLYKAKESGRNRIA